MADGRTRLAGGAVRGAPGARRALAARPALIDGSAGLVWSQEGRPRVAFACTIADGRIIAIDLVADPEHLREMDLEILDG